MILSCMKSLKYKAEEQEFVTFAKPAIKRILMIIMLMMDQTMEKTIQHIGMREMGREKHFSLRELMFCNSVMSKDSELIF